MGRANRRVALGLLFAGLAAVLACACEDDLGRAMDDLRAAAPPVCADWCEDKVACGWVDRDGDLEDEAYSAQIRRCIVDCAWHADEGAHVIESFGDDTLYVGRVSGGGLADLLECVYALQAYACDVLNPDAPVFSFDPGTERRCGDVDACFAALGIDYRWQWTTFGGGVCQEVGTQRLDSPFF